MTSTEPPERDPALGCPSIDHGDEVVPATVSGKFVNRYNPAMNKRTSYCEECARLLRMVRLFEPDDLGY